VAAAEAICQAEEALQQAQTGQVLAEALEATESGTVKAERAAVKAQTQAAAWAAVA
jgi:hypothetical protein